MYSFSSPILTSMSCISELQTASEFLENNELTVHAILSTLICGKWHLEMQAILFLVRPTVANRLTANGNENRCSVIHCSWMTPHVMRTTEVDCVMNLKVSPLNGFHRTSRPRSLELQRLSLVSNSKRLVSGKILNVSVSCRAMHLGHRLGLGFKGFVHIPA